MPIVPFDKFYTKKEIALECINSIPNISNYDVVVEPSAGNGAFSSQLKNCIAYDILPENKNVKKCDFFEIKKINGEHLLFVGNPPFGLRSSIAKKFIKHSILLGAETIAFILPNTFSKVTNQGLNLFSEDWKLVVEKKLPRNSFSIKNEIYHVPCSFYVWTRLSASINLRKKRLPKPREFKFLPRGSKDADFVLNGNSAKIKTITEVTNSKAEHYIKILDKEKKNDYINLFNKIDFRFESSCNGGNAWISQQEIIEAYYQYKNINYYDRKRV